MSVLGNCLYCRKPTTNVIWAHPECLARDTGPRPDSGIDERRLDVQLRHLERLIEDRLWAHALPYVREMRADLSTPRTETNNGICDECGGQYSDLPGHKRLKHKTWRDSTVEEWDAASAAVRTPRTETSE